MEIFTIVFISFFFLAECNFFLKLNSCSGIKGYIFFSIFRLKFQVIIHFMLFKVFVCFVKNFEKHITSQNLQSIFHKFTVSDSYTNFIFFKISSNFTFSCFNVVPTFLTFIITKILLFE